MHPRGLHACAVFVHHHPEVTNARDDHISIAAEVQCALRISTRASLRAYTSIGFVARGAGNVGAGLASGSTRAIKDEAKLARTV